MVIVVIPTCDHEASFVHGRTRCEEMLLRTQFVPLTAHTHNVGRDINEWERRQDLHDGLIGEVEHLQRFIGEVEH